MADLVEVLHIARDAAGNETGRAIAPVPTDYLDEHIDLAKRNGWAEVTVPSPTVFVPHPDGEGAPVKTDHLEAHRAYLSTLEG